MALAFASRRSRSATAAASSARSASSRLMSGAKNSSGSAPLHAARSCQSRSGREASMAAPGRGLRLLMASPGRAGSGRYADPVQGPRRTTAPSGHRTEGTTPQRPDLHRTNASRRRSLLASLILFVAAACPPAQPHAGSDESQGENGGSRAGNAGVPAEQGRRERAERERDEGDQER